MKFFLGNSMEMARIWDELISSFEDDPNLICLRRGVAGNAAIYADKEGYAFYRITGSDTKIEVDEFTFANGTEHTIIRDRKDLEDFLR